MTLERTAADIMTSPVITVHEAALVKEVTRALAENEISGVPVVDAADRLLGMVTESDLMVRVAGPHLPPHIELLGGVIYLGNPRDVNEELRKTLALTAGEIMSRDVVTVEATTGVRDVAQLMLRRKLSRVPVLRDGLVVGIITRHDIIETLMAEGD